MYEIAAIILSSAASSFATYLLVVRHLVPYLDEAQQESVEQRKHLDICFINQIDDRRESLETLHSALYGEILAVIPKEVSRQVEAKLGVLDSNICDSCGNHVAHYARDTDGRVQCQNCARAAAHKPAYDRNSSSVNN